VNLQRSLGFKIAATLAALCNGIGWYGDLCRLSYLLIRGVVDPLDPAEVQVGDQRRVTPRKSFGDGLTYANPFPVAQH
jgi:hypothetical protein